MENITLLYTTNQESTHTIPLWEGRKVFTLGACSFECELRQIENGFCEIRMHSSGGRLNSVPLPLAKWIRVSHGDWLAWHDPDTAQSATLLFKVQPRPVTTSKQFRFAEAPPEEILWKRDSYRKIRQIAGDEHRGLYLCANQEGHHVVLKAISLKSVDEREMIRFRRSWANLKELKHPNIPAIYTVNLEGDRLAIYMEYIQGRNLADILAQRALSPEETVDLALNIANALEHMHHKKIVHRNINPSNIVVGEGGIAKLVGFGKSKSWAASDKTLDMVQVTMVGEAMGEYGYAPPEELIGDAAHADHRCDIFSLAAVLYHAVCGRPFCDPKRHTDYFEKVAQQIPPTPPSEISPKIPKELSDIIMKGLNYDPEQRYNRITDMIVTLKDVRSRLSMGTVLQQAKKHVMAMFPSKPRLPGIDIEILFQPCQEISGDFYDMIALPDGRHILCLGDVSGHGVEVASVVGMVKMAIQIFAKRIDDPGRALGQVNAEVRPNLLSGTFATVLLGFLDPEKMRLSFALAGHPPPIIYNPARRAKPFPVHTEGHALGLLAPKFFACRSFPLKLRNGDLILLYTDGVVEAMNPDRELFGEERLYASVIKHSHKPLRRLLRDLEEEITLFAGVKEDDLTLMAIRINRE